MDRSSNEAVRDVERSDDARDRIICFVARDVLSLDRQDADSSAVLTSVWRGRWVIVACVLGFGMLATAYALVATEWYTAEVVLTPQPAQNTQGLTSQAGSLGLGVLAGLASIGLAGTHTAEPLAVLRSRDFARQFIEEHELLHVLLADKWDAGAGRWRETDPRRQPDIRDAIEYFDNHVLLVNEDKRTDLVTVGIRWKDPALAASWANMVVDRLNEQMRARALAEGEANVAYLQKELAATTIVGVQQAISRLLETELQKVMVARGERQFAFRVVDHADVPKRRSWPKRRIVVALGILAGGLAGLAAVFVRELFARRPFDET